MERSPQKSRRSSLAYERILNAACNRIASDGINGVRLADVAADADVSVALIHYHLESRDGLLVEALRYAYRGVQGRLEVWERSHARSRISERLVAMVDYYLPVPGESDANEWRLWVDLYAEALRDPELNAVAQDLNQGYHDSWVEALSNGVRSGEFGECDVERVADRILALMDGLYLRVLLADEAMSLERARHETLVALAEALALPVERLTGPRPASLQPADPP